LLLDTYSLFYRAFHALPPMNTTSGEPTQALYGLSVLLLKLLREERPSALAFALDAPQATFRHESYAQYKAGRAETPRELVSQFARLDALIRALGVPAHRSPGFEADDVLATLARGCREREQRVLIVSGDRDLLQLVRDGVDVLFVGARGKTPERYDVSAIERRFGFAAERLPTYTALVGDAADNLPKVPGIGERSAQKLVQAHENAASLLANIERWPGAKVREAVQTHAAQILETERLARLRDDVPLADAPPTAALRRESLSDLADLFQTLEFRSLLPRLEKLRESS
jgi:DNA polymerase-1